MKVTTVEMFVEFLFYLYDQAICSPCAVLNHSGHNIRYLKQAIDASKMELLSLLSEAKYVI